MNAFIIAVKFAIDPLFYDEAIQLLLETCSRISTSTHGNIHANVEQMKMKINKKTQKSRSLMGEYPSYTVIFIRSVLQSNKNKTE